MDVGEGLGERFWTSDGAGALSEKMSLLPAILLSLSLLAIASLPGSDLHEVQTGPDSPLLRFLLSDPFMHFLTYALLAALLGAGFGLSRDRSFPFVQVALLAAGYGLLIEVYQWILPSRGFGLDDLVWNTAGVGFAMAVLWSVQHRLSRTWMKPQTTLEG